MNQIKIYFKFSLVFLILIISSCNDSSEIVQKFKYDCPSIFVDKEYTHFDNKFSITIPRGWVNNSGQIIDSNFVNVLFCNDSISEVTTNGKFIRFHCVGVISYEGKYDN